ncbi:MAG: helix-turn-helix transcriptional regulator [Ktedonobacterales bacterium]
MYVDILILVILAARPQHGYDIKKSVQQIAGRSVSLNNGQLYPALRRFEEMGAIQRVVERQEGKPDRHIYHLTALGHEVLHDLVAEFPPEVARLQNEFLVRVSMFDLLEPEERLEILAARRADLQRSLDHRQQILAMVGTERLAMTRFAQRTMQFDEQQIQHELEWIDELVRNVEAPEGDKIQP